MSCEFCKDGNCRQKAAPSSAAEAFGIEDPSQLVDAAPTSHVAKETQPVEKSDTSACFNDAKGACCRMRNHVLDLPISFSNDRVTENVWTIFLRET